MDLKALAAKPNLKQIALDDTDTVAEYGEPLIFYIFDRQPIDSFVRMANLRAGEFRDIVDIVNAMILDSEGQPVVSENATLPNKIYMRVIEKVIAELGK